MSHEANDGGEITILVSPGKALESYFILHREEHQEVKHLENFKVKRRWVNTDGKRIFMLVAVFDGETTIMVSPGAALESYFILHKEEHPEVMKIKHFRVKRRWVYVHGKRTLRLVAVFSDNCLKCS